MTASYLLTVLLKGIVPYIYLLQASAFFGVVVTGILLFIGFFLFRHHKEQQRKKELRALFSDLIAETIICDSEAEKKETLDRFLAAHPGRLQKPFARKILIRELVRTKDSLSGGAAENLRWLYETLGLDQDTLRNFGSKSWHRKAKAIQQFAEMQQARYLVKIYRETNHKNTFIRTEAQIAVVKLTGFKGLRFLNIVSHPVTQWQQLSLLSQLREGEIEEDKIKTWIGSKNETVVEFALRLCQIFKCFDLHDAVVKSLQHPSEAVRLQALQALKEIVGENTTEIVLKHFPAAGKQEQMLILDVLTEGGVGAGELNFLTTLLHHPEEAVRYQAMQLIRKVSPAWLTVITRQISNNPSLTYLLPSLQKEAV